MKQITTSFTRYELDLVEESQGTILNGFQVARMQNLMADYAESQLNLRCDPLNPSDFIKEHAFFTGQVALLKYLIEASDSELRKIGGQEDN